MNQYGKNSQLFTSSYKRYLFLFSGISFHEEEVEENHTKEVDQDKNSRVSILKVIIYFSIER